MNKRYTVAVLICTYNPQWDKLKETIDSCLQQKDVNMQIIITDDGSADNLFAEVRAYFEKRHVVDYMLVPAAVNQGTVKNIIKGLNVCQADYIKFISPGDFFCTKNTLSMWLSELVASGREWSFSKAIYYQKVGNKNIPVKERAHPCIVEPYVKKDDRTCRWNYVVLEDNVLGAAVLSKADITTTYLSYIDGKVKYAEDNIWRLMMFDGIVPLFYDANSIMYEYGTGVSTSSSAQWATRLRSDWNNTTALYGKTCGELTEFQKDMLKNLREVESFSSKLSRLFCQKGRMRYSFIKRLHPRMTDINEETLCR